ncbi:UV DNA damage repair endonuclease UvsE [Methanoregula formicica]|uniref:UV damage endonuclease UvdE n=1 Tax=Methanoregula formicica (strain DSM 22288 / NBRC 105244 / SMSP) TaxID=593750 RepID=L0HEA1_METFS|nr:UV DNA damage repair endonuclease UvsE [Methanoregula formicica]AGB03062.1 UV damage endonuclease UvdE [Methanoregula formicica SMSP]
MRIGYPCINRGIGCSANKTFRLASYSEERLVETVAGNLACLKKILVWNRQNGILFFRITSDLVPFASHPVCTFPWQEHFKNELAETGEFIRKAGIRISMHPDQFIVLNAPDMEVAGRSIAELAYHAGVLDAMGLDRTAKIQLHIGGVYGDKEASLARFARTYEQLDPAIRRRLVIENDDLRFTAADCLNVHEETGVPVLFDVFHHACNNAGEEMAKALLLTGETWKKSDGIPMIDYSSQHPGKRPGSHADHIDPAGFSAFLDHSRPCDRDIMLEIKDKEVSALVACDLARNDPRFFLQRDD